MVQCDKCNKDQYMPFRCSYCGGYFCSEHRLPEFHDCTGLRRGLGSVNLGKESSSRPSYTYRPPRRFVYSRLFSFSDREVRHLIISLILISSILINWLVSDYGWRSLSRNPILVLGGLGIFAAAFLLHELAHKFYAQRLGYWAEFRLNMIGLLITLMSFLPNSFKVIAPGAVVISGLMHDEDYGKISFAGPITNIVQALIFIIIGFFSNNLLISSIANAGVIINSSLALFNLLPFGIFDGAKILRWEWRIWLVAFAASGLMFLNAI